MAELNLLNIVSDYFNNQFNTINHNLHDITNIGYTYFLLAIVIKILRRGAKNE